MVPRILSARHEQFCLPKQRSRSLSRRVEPLFRERIRPAAATSDTITRPMRIVEKGQLMSAEEIDRTLQRLAHEIVEKSGGTKHLALIGIVRRGVPLAQRNAQAMRGIDGVKDRKSTRLNSSHGYISYAGFCLKKKNSKEIVPGADVFSPHYRLRA